MWSRFPNRGKGRGPGGKFFGLWIRTRRKTKKMHVHTRIRKPSMLTRCPAVQAYELKSLNLLVHRLSEQILWPCSRKDKMNPSKQTLLSILCFFIHLALTGLNSKYISSVYRRSCIQIIRCMSQSPNYKGKYDFYIC